MKRTAILYSFLVLALLFRINSVCEGDFLLCQAAGERSLNDRYLSEERTSPGQEKLETFRIKTAERVRKDLPSPHSELLLGMSVGIDNLYEVPKFKKMLRDTGTIHVVVVSGYNVTLVYNTIIRLLGSPYKTKNLALGITATLLFSVVSGFEPPVVRAWVMGSIIALGKFYGRKISALSVLLFTGLLMAITDPDYMYNLSFQLSFLATLSLIMFEHPISALIKKFTSSKYVWLEDLSATLSAQVLIWPFLSLKFGQVSLMSPLVNALVLWTVPLSTILGSIYLFLSAVSGFLGAFLAILVYVPLDFFVTLIEYFSRFTSSVASYQIPVQLLLGYYALLVFLYLRDRRKSHDN